MAVGVGAAPGPGATAGPPDADAQPSADPSPASPSHPSLLQPSPSNSIHPSPTPDLPEPSTSPSPQPAPPPNPTSVSSAPHIKTHHHCTTPDGWRLHLVRTRVAVTAAAAAAAAAGGGGVLPARRCPIVLCPGLGSSGAYTFDLSPVVSLADHLASRGWDVWTVELRGNGQSDRPRLFVRSRWWTIDDYVTKDAPAVLSYVRQISGAARVHVLGHSMGGMILTRLLALGGEAAAAVASATVIGSGCFLRGSWWQALEHTMWVARFLWLVPAGATLRAYAPLALGRAGLPLVDELYFWPPNTDPVLARAVLARNFSAISGGVILQISSGFGARGVCTVDGKEAYADPGRLARVETPVLFVCGDRDRMCPPKGAAATCALFTGSRCARFVELGPKSYGTRDHYGHFDILMGRRAEQEVFPLLTEWLEQHDKDEDEQPPGPPGKEVAVKVGVAGGGGGGLGSGAGLSEGLGLGGGGGRGGGGGVREVSEQSGAAAAAAAAARVSSPHLRARL